MEYYAGLDVSLKSTHVCVVDDAGKAVWRGVSASRPDAIEEALRGFAPELRRVVLETGATSPWLAGGLRALGFPVICADARHAKPMLANTINKTDRNDAFGLARLARAGMLREVHVKSVGAQQIRAALAARDQLSKTATRLKNAIRGVLKPFGEVIGEASGSVFTGHVREALKRLGANLGPMMTTVVEPLLAAWTSVRGQAAQMTRKLRAIAARDATCRLLTTMPGVGAIGALAFASTVDEVGRFGRARTVGAHFGMTPRRSQSGEVDFNGRISKCGDPLLRALLYECAGVMLYRWRGTCAMKAWAERLSVIRGASKARVALMRKMSVTLLAMWRSGTPFDVRRGIVAEPQLSHG